MKYTMEEGNKVKSDLSSQHNDNGKLSKFSANFRKKGKRGRGGDNLELT